MNEHIFFVNAHPDDFRPCMATAIMIHEAGKHKIHVIDMTYGERGLLGEDISPEECAATREMEENSVCEFFNTVPVWLGEKDGSACANEEACQKLACLFKEHPPRAIFTHWPVDMHVDHAMCGVAVLNAIRIVTGNTAGLMHKQRPEIYFYMLAANSLAVSYHHFVPFDERIMDQKKTLIRKYVCQKGSKMAEREQGDNKHFGSRVHAPYAEVFASYQYQVSGKCFLDELLELEPMAGLTRDLPRQRFSNDIGVSR